MSSLGLWLRGLDRSRLAGMGVALGVLLLAPAAGGQPPARLAVDPPPATPEPIDAERVVFLLQYMAVDYGLAVRDGAIANPFEYREMLEFSRLLAEQTDALELRGASAAIRTGLVELRERVRAASPWSEVRALASSLAQRLVDELDVVALPLVAPDLARGREVYDRRCAGCHGASGRGDGPSAPGMDPPPARLDDPRMKLVSPHHLYGALRFGIGGTAMPSYQGELDPTTLWDVSFFVMTLRSDFSPQPPERELPLTLAELARHSDGELLARLRERGVEAEPADIDYYRAFPGSVSRSARVPERRAGSRAASGGNGGAPSSGSDLNVARSLQDAFAGVAERGAASVVGVTGLLRRDGGPDAPPGSSDGGSWREGSLEERLYPGFRRVRSGSGFLVSGDGYILTTHQLLADDGGEPVDVVDVELHDGRHRIARIVGVEPTIGLGVLQLEQLPGSELPRLSVARIGNSDAVRVGHWAIALGNPPGPGTTFAVGTLSSRPERQCYQGDLTATLMQTSLSVPASGYGGPLLNIEGEVVGMLVPGPGAELPELARPLEFALPIDLAMAIYEPLKTRESRRSPWLGFSVLELRQASRRLVNAGEGAQAARAGAAPRRRRSGSRRAARLPHIGVYIDDVYEPSPAAAADIRVGDRLISIDGHRLVSVGTFQKWLYLSGIGRAITLEISRDGEILEKHVTVAERPAAAVPR